MKTWLEITKGFDKACIQILFFLKMSILQSLQLSDNRTIGIMMISLGSFFFFIGILMIFDRGLMALGNLLFLGYINYLCMFYLYRGFPFLIGFQTTLAFFNPIRHPTVLISSSYIFKIEKSSSLTLFLWCNTHFFL